MRILAVIVFAGSADFLLDGGNDLDERQGRTNRPESIPVLRCWHLVDPTSLLIGGVWLWGREARSHRHRPLDDVAA
jgi:hypothetical protein